MNNLKKILEKNNLNKSTNKFGTDKGDFKSYVDLFYENYFSSYKNKKINLLEIGFRNGASLFLWSKYFKNGNILGLDNGSDSLLKEKSYVKEWINESNIQTRICDAYSKKVSKSIKIKFDFIIDDGPHDIRSQIRSIQLYFSKLKDNGTLIIEDLIKGYISCFFLNLVTPLNTDIKILNFRRNKPGRDNMLFVIKKKRFRLSFLIKRLLLSIYILYKFPQELFYKTNFLEINKVITKREKDLYLNLNDFSFNIYSQNGEDGIIQEINNKLKLHNTENYWCVEFGAWDGVHLSNTYNLITKGCKGIYIEGDKRKFKELLKTKEKHPNLIAFNKYISKNYFSENSLDNILSQTEIPIDFDLLSIDIDSFDLEVWESLKNYFPKIIIIEINSEYPPGVLKWHSDRNANVNGNSFSATLNVAKDKGYELVFHSGNMIFVRKELFNHLNINPKFIKYPELLYNDTWLSIEKNKYTKLVRRIFAFLIVKIINRIKKFSFL